MSSQTQSNDLIFGDYRVVWNETKAEIRERLIRDYGFAPESIVMATYPPDAVYGFSQLESHFWTLHEAMRKTESERLGQ